MSMMAAATVSSIPPVGPSAEPDAADAVADAGAATDSVAAAASDTGDDDEDVTVVTLDTGDAQRDDDSVQAPSAKNEIVEPGPDAEREQKATTATAADEPAPTAVVKWSVHRVAGDVYVKVGDEELYRVERDTAGEYGEDDDGVPFVAYCDAITNERWTPDERETRAAPLARVAAHVAAGRRDWHRVLPTGAKRVAPPRTGAPQRRKARAPPASAAMRHARADLDERLRAGAAMIDDATAKGDDDLSSESDSDDDASAMKRLRRTAKAIRAERRHAGAGDRAATALDEDIDDDLLSSLSAAATRDNAAPISTAAGRRRRGAPPRASETPNASTDPAGALARLHRGMLGGVAGANAAKADDDDDVLLPTNVELDEHFRIKRRLDNSVVGARTPEEAEAAHLRSVKEGRGGRKTRSKQQKQQAPPTKAPTKEAAAQAPKRVPLPTPARGDKPAAAATTAAKKPAKTYKSYADELRDFGLPADMIAAAVQSGETSSGHRADYPQTLDDVMHLARPYKPSAETAAAIAAANAGAAASVAQKADAVKAPSAAPSVQRDVAATTTTAGSNSTTSSAPTAIVTAAAPPRAGTVDVDDVLDLQRNVAKHLAALAALSASVERVLSASLGRPPAPSV